MIADFAADVLKFRNLSPRGYEKLEKRGSSRFEIIPASCYSRHAFWSSEMLRLSSRGIVVNVEHHMLPQSVTGKEL